MKYIKNFKTLFPINESRTVKDTASLMNALLVNVFATYKSNMKVEPLFENSDLGDIPLDIYDFFTDVKSLLQLGESGIQEFADNMGVGDDGDIVVSILTITYKDKFKRDIIDDLDKCISYLKDNNLSEQYLDELVEFKELLKK